MLGLWGFRLQGVGLRVWGFWVLRCLQAYVSCRGSECGFKRVLGLMGFGCQGLGLQGLGLRRLGLWL